MDCSNPFANIWPGGNKWKTVGDSQEEIDATNIMSTTHPSCMHSCELRDYYDSTQVVSITGQLEVVSDGSGFKIVHTCSSES